MHRHTDPALHRMCMLMDEAGNNVIQVDGIICVGVLIGSPGFLENFVAATASGIITDVETVKLVYDQLIYFTSSLSVNLSLLHSPQIPLPT